MGQAAVEAMLVAGDLEQVTPSTENAARLFAEAERHLRSAELLADTDPSGGYDMLYAAARKSMTAVLAVQGCARPARVGTSQFKTQSQPNSAAVERWCARSVGCGVPAMRPTTRGWTPPSSVSRTPLKTSRRPATSSPQ